MDCNDAPSAPTPRLSRRAILAGGSAAGLSAALSGCGFFTSGAAATTDTVTFWDMPWSQPEYNELAKKIVMGYAAEGSMLPASYQVIQWNGFLQTFTAAVASKTNPAASSGAGFQAFQFAAEGAIHMADGLLDRLETSGMLDDFLPGLVDALHTDQGQVAIPWQVAIRPAWYRRSLLDRAGVAPPTNWDEWREVAAALKKIGSYGFAVASGAGNNSGSQVLIGLMIMNGGGLFDEDGNPDALYDRNLEAMEFVREFLMNGWIDPGSLSYTAENQRNQWLEGTFAFGLDVETLADGMGDVADDLEVADLIEGPHGDTGTLQYVNNLMMYANTPSVESTEAFLEHYLGSMHAYWDEQLLGGLPVLRSIAESDAVRESRHLARMLDIWQPVGRPLSSRGDNAFPGLAVVDGGVALSRFAQTMLSADANAEAALRELQNGLETAIS